MLRLLDPWLYRRPFEGASARRYARDERPAFGDLDARLCDRWHAELVVARTLIDVGAGPGRFGRVARARFPDLQVIEVEPSRALARGVRGCAEALPLRDGAADAALMLSAIRHVRDRIAALAELRRVVRPGGVAWIVELDPDAERARVRAHAAALGSSVLRAAFGPLVVATAPTAAAIAAMARRAGWTHVDRDDDPVQPVYLLRLG